MWFKTFFFIFLCLLTLTLSAPAHAAVVFDSLTGSVLDAVDMACQQNGISYHQVGDPNFFPCTAWRQRLGTSPTTTPIHSTGLLTSITLKAFTQPEIFDCYSTGSQPVPLKVFDAVSNTHIGKGNLTKAEFCNTANRTFTDITFNFDPEDTINFASTTLAMVASDQANFIIFFAQTETDTIVPSTYPDGNALYKYCNNGDCGGGINPVPDTLHDLMMRIEATDGPVALPVNGKVPVLIVPGVLGTEIKKDDTILWASILRMVNPVNLDSFMDPLAFNINLTPIDKAAYPTEIIGNPDRLYSYTDKLIAEFKAQGYIDDKEDSQKTLFTFPYDWRYGVSGKNGNTTTVDLLNEVIQKIRRQTHSDKINIVAHSTGGLLIKKYVMDHPTDNFLDKVVFVGVPNLGAPKALKVLLAGDSFDVPGLSDLEMKKISQNLPVVYDLAPSQAYVAKNGSYVKIVTAQGFGSEVQNLDFNQTNNFLLNDHHLNNQALINAGQLHSMDFDSYDMRSAGVNLYAIVGCKSPTLGTITEFREKGQSSLSVKGYTMSNISGDGTVPLGSAESLKVNTSNLFYAIKANHGKMLSAEGIRKTIVNLVSGSIAVGGNNVMSYQDMMSNPNTCKLKGHWWEMHSPVSLDIFDQDGNHAGIVPDGSIQNDIPGSGYQIIGDHKFIFVPTDNNQSYSVNFKGTGAGTFTFKDQAINNDSIVQTQVFSNLPVTTLLRGRLNLGTVTTLSLDTNGDGTIDQTVQPSSFINANESLDVIPPVSSSAVSGALGKPGYYKSNVSIQLSAQDPVIQGKEPQTSGLFETWYRVDVTVPSSLPLVPSVNPFLPYNAPISLTAEGIYTVSFFSTDKAGNNEPEKIIVFNIDKTAPEAIVEFSPVLKDLQFTGKDNFSTTSQVTVLDQDDSINLTDQAGNVTLLKLKSKNRKAGMRAQIKSISYNSISADLGKNVMAFLWLLDKSKNLTFLSQTVLSRKNYVLTALYDGKKTSLIGKDAAGVIAKSFSGLKVLKVITNVGDMGWGY